MLSQLEHKLTSLVADGLSLRTHLSVLEAPGPPPALDAGKGAVLVSLSELTPATTFERGQLSFNGSQSRRILPIGFAARIEFFLRPASTNAAGLASARETLLDDLALASHRLAQESFASGGAFAVADPDPGFSVRSFLLEGGGIVRDADPDNLAGVLRYRGSAELWPPGEVQQEGEIRAVDAVIVALPLEIDAKDTVVRAGQSATIRVRSLGGQRLMVREPRQTQPLQIAVTVVSDAAPAQRGSISGGTPGVETGFRIIDLTPPQTAVSYQAPASGITRTRIEYVAIHLASPDRRRGVFLGSAAVRLEPA
jgi:hypothetical protein